MNLHSGPATRIQDGVFREGELSIGLTLPLLNEQVSIVDFNHQLELAKLADAGGFRALWVRDVPLNSASYPDPVGHLDPWVFLGALAASTKHVALVSGAIVITLRHHLHVAKAALSVSALSGGRFILGLGSGDRHEEYLAFGKDIADRRKLYFEGWQSVVDALSEPQKIATDIVAENAPNFYMLPKAIAQIPLLSVGSGGQSVDWIARNSIGWMTYHREPEVQSAWYKMWSDAIKRAAPAEFRGFGVAMKLLLSRDPNQVAVPIPLGYSTGRRDLITVLERMRENGVNHVSFNLADSERDPKDVVEELSAYVNSEFH